MERAIVLIHFLRLIHTNGLFIDYASTSRKTYIPEKVNPSSILSRATVQATTEAKKTMKKHREIESCVYFHFLLNNNVKQPLFQISLV